jgi:AraC family transcriptional regulator
MVHIMLLQYEKIPEGSARTITRFDEGLGIVVGSGRGCILYGDVARVTIVVPLRGGVEYSTSASAHLLTRGTLLVCDDDQSVQIRGRGQSMWVAILAPAHTWRDLVGAGAASLAPGPILLPGAHASDRPIRRAVASLVRVARESSKNEPSIRAAAVSFACMVSDLQTEFDTTVARCPGRTLAQRRNVFLRLQRARNLMTSSSNVELTLSDCARIASYSPCYFIRAFSAAFGETPYALLIEQRLRRAHGLLRTSALGVEEVAHVIGFVDRCAFARSFKRRFGITATNLRDERKASMRAVA